MSTQTYVNARGVTLSTTPASGVSHSFWAAAPGTVTTSPGGGHTLYADGFNDTFYIYSATDQVIVPTGMTGDDTVVDDAWNAAYSLAPGVQNLVLTGNDQVVTGNAGDDLIIAQSGTQTMIAGSGDDVFVCDSSPDTIDVQQGGGSQVLYGFVNGLDHVSLGGSRQFINFAAVQAAMTQVGSNVLLNMGNGQTITFENAQMGAFVQSDFYLPLNITGMPMTFDGTFNTFSASPSGVGTIWSTTLGHGGRTLPANAEAEYYSDSSVGVSPFSIANGILTITAAPTNPASNSLGLPYTSGAITTDHSFAQLYGYFEMSAKLPAGQGFWPAFWLLPANGAWPPELDAMEQIGSQPNTDYVTVHFMNNGTEASVGASVDVGPTNNGFNTYGVYWTPTVIEWFFNGQEIATAPTPADMNTPMYMTVNLAVGGAGSWPGAPASGATAQMEVQYVHAYAYTGTGLIGGLNFNQQLELVYIAYFDRAADGGGFAFWGGQNLQGQESGQSAALALTNIANSFALQPETYALYPFLSTPDLNLNTPAAQAGLTSFITSLYENLFDRAPDAPGEAYWVGQLTSGAVGLGAAALAIASGATGADVIEVQNKIAVALDFTTRTAAAGLGETAPLPASFHTAAQTVLSGVDGATLNDASVTAGINRTTAYISDPTGAALSGGSTITAFIFNATLPTTVALADVGLPTTVVPGSINTNAAPAADANVLQGGANITTFAVNDSTANVAASLDALERDNKLSAITLTDTNPLSISSTQLSADVVALDKITGTYSLAVSGTSGADTADLSNIAAPATINLEGGTIGASAGLSASSLSFLSPVDTVIPGSAAAMVQYAVQPTSGIEAIFDFQYGLDRLDLLGVAPGQVAAFDTTLNGQHAIALASSSDLSHVIVLAGLGSNLTAGDLLADHQTSATETLLLRNIS
jgi:hypothetical protein